MPCWHFSNISSPVISKSLISHTFSNPLLYHWSIQLEPTDDNEFGDITELIIFYLLKWMMDLGLSSEFNLLNGHSRSLSAYCRVVDAKCSWSYVLCYLVSLSMQVWVCTGSFPILQVYWCTVHRWQKFLLTGMISFILNPNHRFSSLRVLFYEFTTSSGIKIELFWHCKITCILK